MPNRQNTLVVLVLLLAVSGNQALAKGRPIPPAAAAVIKRVHDAAAAKNYAMLRSTMDDEFDWSFGGDAGIDAAFDGWRHDASYLRNLRRITGGRCGMRQDTVQCPVNAGYGYRAGFSKTAAGWRMIYFVAGD